MAGNASQRHLAVRVLLMATAAAVLWLLLGLVQRDPLPALTAGCFPARPHASGTSVAIIDTSDGPRSYRLHVPPSYDGTQTFPVLLSFHGLSHTAAIQEFISGFSPLSDNSDNGFLVVYPEGSTSSAIPATHWNAWQLPAPEANDVAFVDQLLDQLQSQLCIARDRVYIEGVSNGGMMVVRLACSLPDRIAAVSTPLGLYYPPMSTDVLPNPDENCEGTRPVPIVAFHGTADPLVPYGGGEGLWGITYRPIESSLALWAQHNGCTSGPVDTRLSNEARLIAYSNCTDGANVQLYVVEGGGHGWPPLAPDPETGVPPVDVARQSWQFLSQHTRPGLSLDDSDGDGLSNYFETRTPGCDPLIPNEDGDGVPADEELLLGTNPCVWDSGYWGCADAPVRDPGCDKDTDGDRCMDAWELGPDQRYGGQRDPSNPWDYFNPTGDGFNRMDDISAVASRYYVDAGDPRYSSAADRSAGVGPHAWDLAAPDGVIRLNDILGAVRSYFQDCP